MFDDLLRSIHPDIESHESSDGSLFTLQIVHFNGMAEFVRKNIASRLLTKDVKFHEFKILTSGMITIVVKEKNKEGLYKALLEVKGELKMENLRREDIDNKLNNLSKESCNSLLRKIVALIY